MAGLAGLRRALKADLTWIREHTRLLSRAMEWSDSGRNANRLLTGSDIPAARSWLDKVPADAPAPTELHRDLIAASEQAEALRTSQERKRAVALQAQVRRTRLALGGVGVFALAAAGLGGFAFLAQQDAVAALTKVELAAKAEAQARTFADEQTRLAVKSGQAAQISEQAALAAKLQSEADAASAIASEQQATDAVGRMNETNEQLKAQRTMIETVLASVVAKLPSRWPEDQRSPDYHHLADSPTARSARNQQFNLEAADIAEMLRLNGLSPKGYKGKLVIALRGADLVDASLATARQSLLLKDVRPDHLKMHCLVLVVDQAAGTLSAFHASTVPVDVQMRAQFTQQIDRPVTSLLSTGLYAARFDTYMRPSRNAQPGAIRFTSLQPVRRTLNDLTYATDDVWVLDRDVSHSIHVGGFAKPMPISRHLQSGGRSLGITLDPQLDAEIDFSSTGSVNVKGVFPRSEPRRYGGEYAAFRSALGLSPDLGPTGQTDAIETGEVLDVILLTGLDASVAAASRRGKAPNEDLRRLRYGSSAPLVSRLRVALGLSADDIFDIQTMKALVARQTETLGWSDGIYSPEMETRLRLCVLSQACATRPQ
jgi:hypothetical protein